MKIFSGKTLSQKLERTEARTSADLVEVRKILFPASDADWIEVAGVCVMFDGIESPLTETFGLGLFDEITNVELDGSKRRGCTMALMGASPGSQSQAKRREYRFSRRLHADEMEVKKSRLKTLNLFYLLGFCRYSWQVG